MRSCLRDEAATDSDAIAVTWHLPEKENLNYPNEDRSRSLEQLVVVWLRFCLSKIGRAVFELSEAELSGAMAALSASSPWSPSFFRDLKRDKWRDYKKTNKKNHEEGNRNKGLQITMWGGWQAQRHLRIILHNIWVMWDRTLWSCFHCVKGILFHLAWTLI